MGADAAQTHQVAACRSEGRSRHQCARDRARSLHGVIGIELDLQAALAAIEEHGAWPSAACSIATGTRFFCPNGEMPPTW